MPPLFDKNQKLDESELVDSLDNKAPRIHKAMLIYQGFNPETGDLATFVEHCKRAETMYNISGAKFSSSDKDSDTKKRRSAPSSKNGMKMVRNVINKNLCFITLSMVKTKATLPGSANSSKQGLRIETRLSIHQSITRGIPKK